MVPAGNCFPGDAPVQLPDGFKRLDEVAVGDRLTTYNHAERDHFEETAESRIDPDTWRLVTVRQDQGDAGTIEADLLRPLGFFGGQWPNPGDELNLDLPRLGLSGPVQVTAIAACPTIPPGPGRIVLSVFRHSRGSTGTLHLSGHAEPIRVTPLHPIWSPSHNTWIPAGQLTALHSVSLWKSECRVDRYELDVREEPVYNVEVDGDHCYRVGEWGLLVHNTSDENPISAGSGGTEDSCEDDEDLCDTQRTLSGYADQVQGTLTVERKKASVNEISLANGQKRQAESGFLYRGGVTHPLVEDAKKQVKKKSRWHGECGEIENLTTILNEHPEVTTIEEARELFKGATSRSVYVRLVDDPLHAKYQRPCTTCEDVLKVFGIDAPKS